MKPRDLSDRNERDIDGRIGGIESVFGNVGEDYSSVSDFV